MTVYEPRAQAGMEITLGSEVLHACMTWLIHNGLVRVLFYSITWTYIVMYADLDSVAFAEDTSQTITVLKCCMSEFKI